MLRAAIAEELVEKLPATVPLERIPQLLHVPDADVSAAVGSGAISVVDVDDVPCMVTAKSRGFLSRELGIRLPLPDRLDPRQRAEPDRRPVRTS